MKEKVDLTEMQQASDYRTMRNTLRGGGIGSIIFGVIGIGLGWSALDVHPINSALIIIGAGLVIEGVWVISAPSPAGLIAEGIALLVLGLWNILITLNNMAAGDGLPIFGILGAYQAYWGFQSFGRYGRFAVLSQRKPSKETLVQVGEMVKSVLSTKAGKSSRIIEFQEDNKPWKGTFFGEVAVLVKNGGQDVLFTDREHMNVASKSDGKKGKRHKIWFQVGDHNIDGMISPASFSVFEQWKLATA